MFALRQITGSMFMTAMSPITGVMIESYVDLDPIWCTILLMTLTIMYVPTNIPANYLNEKYGLTFSMWAGTVPLVLGVWVRVFQGSMGTGFAWLMIG